MPDLPVVGRDRRGVDDHAALASRVRARLRHRVRAEADHVEGADQVDADDLGEAREIVRRFLADGSLGDADTGAVDQHMQSAKAFDRRPGRHTLVQYLFFDRLRPRSRVVISRERHRNAAGVVTAQTTAPEDADDLFVESHFCGDRLMRADRRQGKGQEAKAKREK